MYLRCGCLLVRSCVERVIEVYVMTAHEDVLPPSAADKRARRPNAGTRAEVAAAPIGAMLRAELARGP